MSEDIEPFVIGCVIVTYNSADVIADCLKSLHYSAYSSLYVVICDNASQDDTCAVVRANAPADFVEASQGSLVARQDLPLARLTLIRSTHNLGFAGGVNLGLRLLMSNQDVQLFWILNPDCMVSPDTAKIYANRAAEAGDFALMGCRTVFTEPGDRIQGDGGRVNRWTGVCESVNRGALAQNESLPAAHSLDYITGANMVASRKFLERVGQMPEEYFLYYEEVDWAFRRGNLPLVLASGTIVYHHGGTAIGSGRLNRRPSSFANYFNYRNRMRFLARFRPVALPSAYLMSLARVMRLVLLGAWDEAAGAARGLHGLAPPAAVRARVAPDSRMLAFGPPQISRKVEWNG